MAATARREAATTTRTHAGASASASTSVQWAHLQQARATTACSLWTLTSFAAIARLLHLHLLLTRFTATSKLHWWFQLLVVMELQAATTTVSGRL